MILILALLPGLVCTLDVDSLTAALHVETGMAYIEQGLSDRALLEFTRALEISDTASEAYLGLGRAASLCGSWESAEENYLTYMGLEPFDHRAALELAEMLLDLTGRYDDALLYAGMALALAPTDGRCRLAVADAKAALGSTGEAVSLYSTVITDNEEYSMKARLRLGGLFYSIGELGDAREALLPAAVSGEAEAHRLLALIYIDQNDVLRAFDSAERYLFLEPNGHWADSARILLEEKAFESSLGNPGD